MAPRTIVPGDFDGAVATDGPVSSPGTEDSETERIRSTVLDYVDGWYAAAAERMARSIHPEVHHRFIRLFPSGVEFLDETGFSKLLKWTASGGGREIPADLQRRTVTVLDRYFRAAVARAVTATGVEHLQLAISARDGELSTFLARPGWESLSTCRCFCLTAGRVNRPRWGRSTHRRPRRPW